MRKSCIPKRTVLGVTTLLLAVACGREQPTKPQDAAPPKPKETVRALPVTLSVQGAFSLVARSASVPLRQVTLLDERFPDLRWYGMESQGWLRDASGASAKPSLNLIPFRGDGKYSVPVTPSQQGGGTVSGSSLSNARLEFRQGNSSRLFGVIKQTCDVEVHGGGSSGSLRCPELSDGKRSVSLTMTWGV